MGIRTYLKRLIINDLTNEEYILIYSSVLVVASFIYCYNRNQNFTNLTSLSCKQVLSIVVSAISSMYLWHISFTAMRENTYVKTNFILKGSSFLILALMGFLIFKEEISIKKIIGIGLVFVGIMTLV